MLVMRLASDKDAYDISTNIDVFQAAVRPLLGEAELAAGLIEVDHVTIESSCHDPILGGERIEDNRCSNRRDEGRP